MSTADNSIKKAIESWLNLFVGRESSEVINKSNQEKLFETFNATVSKIDCIKSMVLNHCFYIVDFLKQSNWKIQKVSLDLTC